jgi:hypothetical protein
MKSVRRGYVDKDEELFGDSQKIKIHSAANDARWLMNRGYSAESAITFTSNHYLLTSRQRMAIFRSILSDDNKIARKEKEIQAPGSEVLIDGLNIIITLETALSNSLVLRGDDGVLRDVAGLHGTYRIIDKTEKAIELILQTLSNLDVKRAYFILDKPVSNSGSLKQLILAISKNFNIDVEVELNMNPDQIFVGKDNVISSDGPVLQRSSNWFNLNSMIVRDMIPDTWIFNFEL